MGSWFRLRADADLSGLGPQALVARAMQTYGAVLADTRSGRDPQAGRDSLAAALPAASSTGSQTGENGGA